MRLIITLLVAMITLILPIDICCKKISMRREKMEKQVDDLFAHIKKMSKRNIDKKKRPHSSSSKKMNFFLSCTREVDESLKCKPVPKDVIKGGSSRKKGKSSAKKKLNIMNKDSKNTTNNNNSNDNGKSSSKVTNINANFAELQNSTLWNNVTIQSMSSFKNELNLNDSKPIQSVQINDSNRSKPIQNDITNDLNRLKPIQNDQTNYSNRLKLFKSLNPDTSESSIISTPPKPSSQLKNIEQNIDMGLDLNVIMSSVMARRHEFLQKQIEDGILDTTTTNNNSEYPTNNNEEHSQDEESNAQTETVNESKNNVLTTTTNSSVTDKSPNSNLLAEVLKNIVNNTLEKAQQNNNFHSTPLLTQTPSEVKSSYVGIQGNDEIKITNENIRKVISPTRVQTLPREQYRETNNSLTQNMVSPTPLYARISVPNQQNVQKNFYDFQLSLENDSFPRTPALMRSNNPMLRKTPTFNIGNSNEDAISLVSFLNAEKTSQSATSTSKQTDDPVNVVSTKVLQITQTFTKIYTLFHSEPNEITPTVSTSTSSSSVRSIFKSIDKEVPLPGGWFEDMLQGTSSVKPRFPKASSALHKFPTTRALDRSEDMVFFLPKSIDTKDIICEVRTVVRGRISPSPRLSSVIASTSREVKVYDEFVSAYQKLYGDAEMDLSESQDDILNSNLAKDEMLSMFDNDNDDDKSRDSESKSWSPEDLSVVGEDNIPPFTVTANIDSANRTVLPDEGGQLFTADNVTTLTDDDDERPPKRGKFSKEDFLLMKRSDIFHHSDQEESVNETVRICYRRERASTTTTQLLTTTVANQFIATQPTSLIIPSTKIHIKNSTKDDQSNQRIDLFNSKKTSVITMTISSSMSPSNHRTEILNSPLSTMAVKQSLSSLAIRQHDVMASSISWSFSPMSVSIDTTKSDSHEKPTLIGPTGRNVALVGAGEPTGVCGRNFLVQMKLPTNVHVFSKTQIKEKIEDAISVLYRFYNMYQSNKVVWVDDVSSKNGPAVGVDVEVYFTTRGCDHLQLLQSRLKEGNIGEIAVFNEGLIYASLNDRMTAECASPCAFPYKCYPGCDAKCCGDEPTLIVIPTKPPNVLNTEPMRKDIPESVSISTFFIPTVGRQYNGPDFDKKKGKFNNLQTRSHSNSTSKGDDFNCDPICKWVCLDGCTPYCCRID